MPKKPPSIGDYGGDEREPAQDGFENYGALSPTETINFDDFLTWEQLTQSSSVDLRGIKQATYGKLLQAIPIPVLFVDQDKRIVFCNKAFGRIWERYLEMMGEPYSILFKDPRDSAAACEALDSVLRDRRPRVFESVLQVGEGRIWGRTHMRSIRVREQKLVLTIVEDLTAEKKRTLLNAKYRQIVNLLPIGLLEFSVSSKVAVGADPETALPVILDARAVDGNPEFARIHGFRRVADLIGARPGEFLPFKGANKGFYSRWISSGFPIMSIESSDSSSEETSRFLENTLIGIVNAGRLMGFWLALRDIGARRDIHAEALRTQKLESLGLLAGGIAHDFNNILTAVLGNLNLARLLGPGNEQIGPRLEEAERAALRARDLTARLMTFSKGHEPVKKVCSLVPILKEAAGFALTGSNIALRVDAPEDLADVFADEGQIGQVINNMALNARQAMPEGGEVVITAMNVSVGPEEIPTLREGEYVKVSVADNGPGIPESHLGRVFDPYFTTKPTGTGLGLATSYAVISKHGGRIDVESRLDVGTTFHIYLPVSAASQTTTQATPVVALQGSGRVLVMDDRADALRVTVDLLESMGYETASAMDTDGAVRLYREAMNAGRPFDVALLDLTAPGAGGAKAAVNEILRMHSDAKTVVISGYSDDPAVVRFREYGFSGVIVKPYDAAQLHETLQRLIPGNDGAGRDCAAPKGR
jgi:signal transduction histidine kinase/ActR/RegA family two-component response regulator